MRIPLGNRGDSSRSGSRTWVTDPHRVNERYQRAYGTRGGPKGATGLDLYFAKEPTDEPLLLFHHIPKTAGTSLRNVINSNYADAAFELVPIDAEEVPDKLAAWYQDLWQSLGSKRERLVCAAGHFAGFFLGVVPDRPVSACTILRDPVDRVISRYFFFTRPPRWTLNDLYGRAELKYMRGANFARGRNRAFFNGESQSILQTFYETEELPLTADEPDCDLWRKRLFELVDRSAVRARRPVLRRRDPGAVHGVDRAVCAQVRLAGRLHGDREGQPRPPAARGVLGVHGRADPGVQLAGLRAARPLPAAARRTGSIPGDVRAGKPSGGRAAAR